MNPAKKEIEECTKDVEATDIPRRTVRFCGDSDAVNGCALQINGFRPFSRSSDSRKKAQSDC
jgi:hypothetical protein